MLYHINKYKNGSLDEFAILSDLKESTYELKLNCYLKLSPVLAIKFKL